MATIMCKLSVDLGRTAYASDDVWDELESPLARFTRAEPEIVVVAADLSQNDEGLAKDLPLVTWHN